MQRNDSSIELFLIIAIALFLLLSLCLLCLLYISRYLRARKRRRIEKFHPLIENLMFPILFKNKDVDDVLNSSEFQELIKMRHFKYSLLIGVIKLSKNYSGELKEKLIEFYTKSSLMDISLKKLKVKKWRIKREGVQELSLMEIKESFPLFKNFISHKEESLRNETLFALIRLKGVKGLLILKNYEFQLNNWVQANLLFEIGKLENQSDVDISDLLHSKNESIVLFTLRVIVYFNQTNMLEEIRKRILEPSSSLMIKKCAEESINKLNSYNI